MEISENARIVMEKRYLKKDENGNAIETPEDMLRRVSQNIAQADANYGHSENEVRKTAEEFYKIMDNLEFLPNSPTLMNAGRELQQLSACFVLPVEDSMESIFDTLKYAALIHKSGGGTGFSFSRIRPKSDVVSSTTGVSSGPVSFMKVYNAATEAIKQGGTRRGANMGILRVDHPDIMEFIKCKENENELTNFNISVALTKKFMEALENDGKYDLVNPRTGAPVRKMRASEVYDTLISMAWKSGDPGIVFIDKINEDNPTPNAGEIESTNPCGEQPLLPFESCNLGSINLSKFVKDGNIDWDHLSEVTRTAVHFLDNVIDMNNFPLPEIAKITRANRKIGLGVMGFHDMLIKMNIPYDSEEGLKMGSKIMEFIESEGVKESVELAKERGVFENWAGSIWDTKYNLKTRNATITTIAPTGTISILAGASSGIEPIFALAFTRNVLDGDKLVEVNPLFKAVAEERGFFSPALMDIVAKKGSVQDVIEIPDDIKRIFVTAHDIDPIWHIKMQAAFQKHTHNAVSKTVNLPNHATEDDVRRVYDEAYTLGCKGITVYRDGCKSSQVLQVDNKESSTDDSIKIVSKSLTNLGPGNWIMPRERPAVTSGSTIKVKTGCGSLFVTVNEDELGMAEVFARMGKSGGCAASQNEAVGRLISLALRSNIDPKEIVEQIRGIRCPNQILTEEGMVYSCADAIGHALTKYLEQKKDIKIEKNDLLSHNGSNPTCPECGTVLVFSEGCLSCPNTACGWSKCE